MPFQSDLYFMTAYLFTDDTPIELSHSLHITLHLFLFHCITHSVLFHVMTLTCCITYPCLITSTIYPLIINALPHLPTLDHYQQHSPLRHPHSHQADLTQSSHVIHPSLSISPHPTAWFHFQTTNLQTSTSTSLPSTPLHNHRISNSRTPLPINCTYASV